MSKLTPHDLASLVQIFDASDWKEMHLTFGESELFLSKDPNATPRGQAPAAAQASAAAPAPTTTPAVGAGAGAPQAPADGVPAGWVAIRAPNLGTFYRRPKPGVPPYVEIGQKVMPDTEVCLIEVMKLFTPVRAGVAGIVREVRVEDAELVEYDQLLFLVEPDA